MPTNNGQRPPFDVVNIKFRNGKIRRNEDPKRWNWKPLIHKGRVIESDWDIVSWQKPRSE